ncbi:MAG: hypothetical protein HYW48_06615 [Deltaproteobacteria bacterium]|nr:hypothetical protein [Deltaproteobacteria bacterium]
MEETAQLVPPRNPGEATLPSPPQPPLSLFAPSGLRITSASSIFLSLFRSVERWLNALKT